MIPGAPVEHQLFGFAGGVPGRLEHQVLHRHQFQRAIGLRFVDQHRGLHPVGVGALAVDLGGGSGDLEQARVNVVEPHGAQFRRQPGIGCRHAVIFGQDVAIGQRHLHILVLVHGLAHVVEADIGGQCSDWAERNSQRE